MWYLVAQIGVFLMVDAFVRTTPIGEYRYRDREFVVGLLLVAVPAGFA